MLIKLAKTNKFQLANKVNIISDTNLAKIIDLNSKVNLPQLTVSDNDRVQIKKGNSNNNTVYGLGVRYRFKLPTLSN